MGTTIRSGVPCAKTPTGEKGGRNRNAPRVAITQSPLSVSTAEIVGLTVWTTRRCVTIGGRHAQPTARHYRLVGTSSAGAGYGHTGQRSDGAHRRRHVGHTDRQGRRG